MRREIVAAAIILAIVFLLPAGLLGLRASRLEAADVRVLELRVRAAADGGWQPEHLRLNKGERVRLLLSSDDVVHGLTIPGLGVEVDEIAPGRVVAVEFTPDRAGRFAFACTRWCSADHWRLRGVIEVVEVTGTASEKARPPAPAYVRQGIDLDALRSPAPTPAGRPSAVRGSGIVAAQALPEGDRSWLDSHSPAEVFAKLRSVPWLNQLSDAEIWDLVAAAWGNKATTAVLARGEQLYQRDCAACHGESGKGDGPAGRSLPGRAALRPAEPRGPIDFTDGTRLLSASDVLLQGKVLRGGMGTGMPEWGSLYSDDDLWAVVTYLRTFQFEFPP
ncbi:MAG: c-type cytochrome [Chloroflexota bacterium]